MPTYQYACTACGHQLEAVQAFTDDSLTQCPECEGRLRKLFSGVGVVFKGSGFYRNDSRTSTSHAGNGGKPADNAGATTDSGGTKPEAPAKPDSSAPAKTTPATSSKTAAG